MWPSLRLGAGAANAENYSFSFIGGGGAADVSGTLSTSTTGSTQTVTGLSGAFNGQSIVLLPSGQAYSSFGLSDNTFYPDQTGLDIAGGSGGYLDKGGIGFLAGDTKYALFFNESVTTLSGRYALTPDAPNQVSPGGTLTVVDLGPTISAAPEPTTWALMLIGVGALGLMLRRRRSVGTLTAI